MQKTPPKFIQENEHRDKKDPFEKSGATFERKVAEKFELAGWMVETKQHYIDPFEGKPREIDLIATKKIMIGDNPEQRMWGFKSVPYEMRIFLECKYLQDKKGLFVRQANQEKHMKTLFTIRTYNSLFWEYYKNYKRIQDDFIGHRYISSENVVYDSTDNSDRGFGVPSVKQIIHGLMSQTHRSGARYSIEYPVIIANDSSNILLRPDGSTENVSFVKPLLFEFDYVDKDERKRHFLVDVITLDQLDTFIQQRNEEFDKLRKLIFEHENFSQHSRRQSSGNVTYIGYD